MNRKARTVRCYTDQALRCSNDIELDTRSSHHISTVLRARVGMQIQLFNGDGHNYSGEIIATGKKTRVQISQVSQSHLESGLSITLVQAIARGDKMDGIIQKATELGIATIQPVYTNQSIAKLEQKRELRKQEHWQAIVVSACEQSGRCVLPEVGAPVKLQSYLDELSDANTDEQRWVLSPIARTSNMTTTQLSSISVLVGPESGFDQDELSACNGAGFSELQLGPRVLRTETAGPAAIAVLQAKYGDLN